VDVHRGVRPQPDQRPRRTINVLTVHWRSAKWIDVQLDYLQRYANGPYRVFASLNGIADDGPPGRFHYASDLTGTHAEKLNELAALACSESDPSDILLFLDGDAFPIAPLEPWISEVLCSYRLAAVRRDENLGDPQPHPSFCVTTVALWQELKGDWRPGGTWTDPFGQECTDVGGTLLHQLRDMGIDWLPLLRTNTSNPHPVWFGIYDHRVYHHGAGFRNRASRVDVRRKTLLEPSPEQPSLGTLRLAMRDRPGHLLRRLPHHLRMVPFALRRTVALRRALRQHQRLDLYEQHLLERLRRDPTFYRELDAAM
jgi:hypothetical protein